MRPAPAHRDLAHPELLAHDSTPFSSRAQYSVANEPEFCECDPAERHVDLIRCVKILPHELPALWLHSLPLLSLLWRSIFSAISST